MYKVLIDRENSNEYALVNYETACRIKGITPKTKAPRRYVSQADRPKVFSGRLDKSDRPLESILSVAEYAAQWRRMNHLTA